MNVTLGNPKPVGGSDPAETTVRFPDPVTPDLASHQTPVKQTDLGRLAWLSEEERRYFIPLLEVEDLWPLHARKPPSFVRGDDPVFVGLLSKVFGCPVQE